MSEEQGIEISRGSAKRHTNQVTFRSLKNLIRDQLDSTWKSKERKEKYDPIEMISIDAQKMNDIVNTAINQYNNRPHKAVSQITPFSMEKHHYNEKKEKVYNDRPLTINEQSIEGQDIKKDQPQAIVQYVPKARVLPKPEQPPKLYAFIQKKAKLDHVISTVDNQKDIIIKDITKQLQAISQKNQEMYQLNYQLQQQMHHIKVEAEKQKVAREEGEERRNKRKNAVKAPIRETIEGT